MGTARMPIALEGPAKLALIGAVEPGRVLKEIEPSTGVAKLAVNAPAAVTSELGTTNVGSPVEFVIGAAVKVAIAGYAVGDGVGVGDWTVPVTPPDSVSVPPVILIRFPDA